MIPHHATPPLSRRTGSPGLHFRSPSRPCRCEPSRSDARPLVRSLRRQAGGTDGQPAVRAEPTEHRRPAAGSRARRTRARAGSQASSSRRPATSSGSAGADRARGSIARGEDHDRHCHGQAGHRHACRRSTGVQVRRGGSAVCPTDCRSRRLQYPRYGRIPIAHTPSQSAITRANHRSRPDLPQRQGRHQDGPTRNQDRSQDRIDDGPRQG